MQSTQIRITKYNHRIYERVNDLHSAGKSLSDCDNYELAKIFEYYVAIKLTEAHNRPFLEYNDISPKYKEDNQMSRQDTGIDCCDMITTIVQCKLRSNTLTWTDCSTFLASQCIFDTTQNKTIIRWDNLILARNEGPISKHLKFQNKRFEDQVYSMKDFIDYCESIQYTPLNSLPNILNFSIRDYQQECIDLITQHMKNLIISLPTGTGKNVIIIHSIKDTLKYLIMVPRLVLMRQLQREILKYKPEWERIIQCIGYGHKREYDYSKSITICVYNSIDIVEPYTPEFEKVFIDEAHHVYKPSIYKHLDNVDDEEMNAGKYMHKIQNLSKLNNNVLLSATIDKMDDYEYYNKDIRTMIDLGYLCDYMIHVPVFDNDPSDKAICKHLINNYRNVIIYCATQKEGKEFNAELNKLLLGCSKYIDCNTPKSEYDNILEDYKIGAYPFLVNVRILQDGFDAPITKGVCFVHMPTRDTTLIQILGRALRLHPDKDFAHVILPSTTDEDGKSINHFIKVMANNDVRIKETVQNNKLGGYVSIEADKSENAELKYELIYDSYCKMFAGPVYDYDIELEGDKLKVWMDINKRMPSVITGDEYEKYLGQFSSYIRRMYRRKKLSDEYIKKIETIEYWYWKHTSITDKVEKYTLWIINYNNCKIPFSTSPDKTGKKIGSWAGVMRCAKRNGELDDDTIKLLENIPGWFWDREGFYEIYEKYKYCLDNNFEPTVERMGLMIEKWISKARGHKKNNELTEDQIKKLEDLPGWKWDGHPAFDEMYEKHKSWIINHNKGKRIPQGTATDEMAKKVGNWAHRLRKYKKKGKLTTEEIEKLETIPGWYWLKN